MRLHGGHGYGGCLMDYPARMAAEWLDRAPVATPAPVAAPVQSPIDVRVVLAVLAACPIVAFAALLVIR